MASSVMKIAAGMGVKDSNEFHHCALTSDGKLWFVGLTGVSQPKFSYYHRTALMGGYVKYLDTVTKEWSESKPFEAIDDDENREDVVFAWKKHLVMLVYSRYQQISFRQLLFWDHEAASWTDVDNFEVDSSVKYGAGYSQRFQLELAANQDGVWAASTNERDGSVRVSQLTINLDDGPASCHMSHVADLKRPNMPFTAGGGWLVAATVYENHFIAIGGSMGCGFRWEPASVVSLDMRSKECRIVGKGDGEVENDSPTCTVPPFAFGGANFNGTVAGGWWVFAGGSVARGMDQADSSAEIWALDLAAVIAGKIEWRKVKNAIPEKPMLHSSEICFATDQGQALLAASRQDGVFAIKIEF